MMVDLFFYLFIYAKKSDPCRTFVWLGRYTVQNMEPGYNRIGSVYAVIWQAGTHRAGPVLIQIYYGLECACCVKKISFQCISFLISHYPQDYLLCMKVKYI